MRTVAVFTGTRAEYGLLKNVMLGILQRGDCTLHTIVSGSHLAAGYGQTVAEIHADGIPVHDCPEILPARASAVGVCTAMGIGLIRYADILEKARPDILVLLGDRYEALAMAAAATVCLVPTAHISGGEATECIMDESFRHCITKMSHLHFTTCEAHRQRVIQLGEEPDRVFNVGSLGVENACSTPALGEGEIRAELGLEAEARYLLCTMHPLTLEHTAADEQIAGLLEALSSFPDHAVVFTAANADPGGESLNALLRRHVAEHPRCRFFPSLGQTRYFSAVRHAACVLGNSSSGVLEVPSFHTPVIDIGDRQKGRIRAASVLHCEADAASIRKALAFALSEEYKTQFALAENPYDRPGTARAIVERLSSWPLDNILKKHFYAVACP